jgi:pimeloyl-ACP methyl ester carboxylesterase
VLEALDLTDVTLVCHSGAGGEAIRYGTRHGWDRISRILFVGATGPRILPPDDTDKHRAMVQGVIDQLATDMPKWISTALKPFAPQADERVLEWCAQMVFDCSRRALVDFQRAIVEADFEAEATAIAVPVTIIHGDQDESAPLQTTAMRYASLIEHNEFLVYEGVAHGIMLTHAARLASDIATRASS